MLSSTWLGSYTVLLLCHSMSRSPHSTFSNRNQKKAEAAAKDIAHTAEGKGHVHAYSADMASLAEIRSFAQNIRKDHVSIDVLINNAGVNALSYSSLCSAVALYHCEHQQICARPAMVAALNV